MKDIKAILADIQLDDDSKKAIVDAVNANYRTIEEVQKKADRIAELEGQNKALTEQVGKLEGDGEELDKLREQVESFKAAEEQRKADEDERSKRESFRSVFETAVGEREFANDIVRDSIFEKAYAKCSEQTGLDARAVIDSLAADADGIWKNPQHDARKLPNPAHASVGRTSVEEAAKKEIKDFLFRKKA